MVAICFDSPLKDGGIPLTNYFVMTNPGGLMTVGPKSPIIITGLSNDVRYTFSLCACNDIGNGPFSTTDAGITPRARPDAPVQIRSAQAGNYTKITFEPPQHAWDVPIEGYFVVANPGGNVYTAEHRLNVPRQAITTSSLLDTGNHHVCAYNCSGVGRFSGLHDEEGTIELSPEISAEPTSSPVSAPKVPTAVSIQQHEEEVFIEQQIEEEGNHHPFVEYKQEYEDVDVTMLKDADESADNFALLSVTLINNNAGAYGDARVDFQPLNDLPAGGILIIQFPNSFLNTSAIRLRHVADGLDGTVSLSVIDRSVTLQRNGDGTDIRAGKHITLTLAGIMNPGQSGVTGDFTIRTVGSDGDEIDQGRADGITIAPGQLEGAEVLLDNSRADSMTEVDIVFVAWNAIPPTGCITIQFPPDVTVRDVSMAMDGACEGMDGSFRVLVNQNQGVSVVSFIRQGDGRVVAPQTEVSITLNVKLSPHTALGVGTYMIQTVAGDGTIIDEDSAVPGLAVEHKNDSASVQPIELLNTLQSAVLRRSGSAPDINIDLVNRKIHVLSALEFDHGNTRVHSKHSHVALQIAHAMDLTQDVMDEFDLGLAHWRIETHVHNNSNSKVCFRLSNERASALKATLIEQHDVDPSSLHTKGHGSTRADSSTGVDSFEILFSFDGRFDGLLPGEPKAPQKESSVRAATVVNANQEDL
jgi:outer membrane protein OmpA-like peptidoglycan-associated protein